MSEHDVANEGAALQFERAELVDAAPGAVTCGVCKGPVAAEYFEVNGALACAACKDGLVAGHTGGSRIARLLAAGGLGLLAAVVGAAIWIAIVRLTGYEIGLVAIGVGFLVGAAVRRGSRGRGGWAYQTMAVVLTYSAMVAYYVPYVIEGLRQGAETNATAPAGSAPELAAAPPSGAAPPSQGAGNAVPAAPAQEASFVGVVIALAVVLGIAFAAPFLAGAENIIGILILLFALYEAWKLNRRQELVVRGPFQMASSEAAAVPAAIA